jgi:nucleotide-binding universal stress UspA family protein
MEIRHILVPVDGSDLSLQAVEAAGSIARRFGAQVTLLTALEPPETVRAYMSEDAVKEVERGLWLTADGMLDQALTRLGDPETRAEKWIEWDSPATAILTRASGGCDLIVMGSRGLGMQPTDRNLLGSVAERVLRRSPCPVLVLPEHSEA